MYQGPSKCLDKWIKAEKLDYFKKLESAYSFMLKSYLNTYLLTIQMTLGWEFNAQRLLWIIQIQRNRIYIEERENLLEILRGKQIKLIQTLLIQNFKAHETNFIGS